MTRSFEFRGNSVTYRLEGKGKPVFLIHGFGEDSRVWDDFLPLLSADRLYILPDLPGHGDSRSKIDFTGIPDMSYLAELMKHLLEELILAGFITKGDALSCRWIGHSMGGYICLALAARYPEYTKAILLFHSTAFADNEEKKELRRKSMNFIRSHGSVAFLQQSTPNLFTDKFKLEHPEKIQVWLQRYQYLEKETLCHYYQLMIDRPESLDLLAASSTIFGFIIGGLDKAVSVKDSLVQCQLPKKSYIQFLSGSAHMGMIEHSAETSEFLEWFLEET